MKHLESNNTAKEKLDPNSLTDYDLCELHIRCVEVFVETLSRLDLDGHRCFEFGQVLWEKTLEARDKYRKSYSDKEAQR